MADFVNLKKHVQKKYGLQFEVPGRAQNKKTLQFLTPPENTEALQMDIMALETVFLALVMTRPPFKLKILSQK